MKTFSVLYILFPGDGGQATWQVLDVTAPSSEDAARSGPEILAEMDRALGGRRIPEQIGCSGDFDRLIGTKYGTLG